MRPIPGFAASLMIGAATISSALADAPKINDIKPLGVKRGEPSDLTINGSGLAGAPVLVAPFPFTAEVAPNSDGGNFRIKVTVPPTVALGVYPIRVKSDNGISNPFLISVGQFPRVDEAEDNSTFEQAQVVPTPVIVEGSSAGSDVDHFKFAGKKGQKIVVDAQCSRIGSGVDPQIRLTTAGRKFVESADDTPGLVTDARLVAVLPEDGDYVIELSDSKYQGGGRPVYRLLIGEIPIASEIYPIGGRRNETIGLELRGGTLNETVTLASPLAAEPLSDIFRPRLTLPDGRDVEIPAPLSLSDLPEIREPADSAAAPVRGAAPVVFNGRIDPAADEDRFVLSVTPGQTLRIRVEASDEGSALDGTLQILGANNAVLATAEDTVSPALPVRGVRRPATITVPDPSLDFAVPAGVTEITLAIKDLIGRGGVGFPYRILVEPVVPAFQLILNESQITVPKGNTVSLGVTLQRQGYNGPVTVALPELPVGLTARPLTIPEGGAGGLFTLTAAKDANFGPVDLKVVGTGQGPAGPIVEYGQKNNVYALQGTLPVNSMTQNGLPSASGTPLPAALEAPETIEAVHGYNGTVPLKVARDAGADGALALALLTPPPGVTVAGTIAEKAPEGAATINTPIESPVGPTNIVLTAKGKLGPAEITLTAPVVRVSIVRPVAVELSAPMVDVKVGTTVEFKGKLVRKEPFKQPVKITLTGLPAGLKADPVDLPAEGTEFALKIIAEPTAAEAMAAVQVGLAFKVGDKDYPFPPTPLAVKVVK